MNSNDINEYESIDVLIDKLCMIWHEEVKNISKKEIINRELELINKLRNIVSNTEDERKLKEVLKNKMLFGYMPIEIMIEFYKRYFNLKYNDIDIFIYFTQYLKCNGPDWDHTADEILNYANNNKYEEAFKIIDTINY